MSGASRAVRACIVGFRKALACRVRACHISITDIDTSLNLCRYLLTGDVDERLLVYICGPTASGEMSPFPP